jgi:Ni/Fe-hydrogenase 1 B-type cytochrome subunit
MKQNKSQENKVKSPFLQKHSASIRIWHWLVFITISFLIITVLFESTMFSPRENTSMIQNVLKEKNIVVTDDQAKAVAHEYGDKLWDLHKLLGFGLSFLLLARIAIEITLSQDEKVRTRIKNGLLLYHQSTENKSVLKHYLIAKYSYSAFYLLVIYMATTGLLLAFGSQMSLSRETHHFVKEMHGFGQFMVYAFIFIHLCGVIIAELKHSKGIISGMVNGGE